MLGGGGGGGGWSLHDVELVIMVSDTGMGRRDGTYSNLSYLIVTIALSLWM